MENGNRTGLRVIPLVWNSGSCPDRHRFLLKEEDNMPPIGPSREKAHEPEAASELRDKGTLSCFSDAHTSKSGA